MKHRIDEIKRWRIWGWVYILEAQAMSFPDHKASAWACLRMASRAACEKPGDDRILTQIVQAEARWRAVRESA